MFRLRDSHPLWLSVPGAFSYTNDFVTSRVNPETAPQPCPYCYWQFGLFPFRSPLLRESHLISLPQGTEMFHFPWLAPITYEFSYG
jgi:hypothetical protein